jgi:hypothetical protein
MDEQHFSGLTPAMIGIIDSPCRADDYRPSAFDLVIILESIFLTKSSHIHESVGIGILPYP